MKTISKKYELIYCDASENNNKFWRGILYDDGTGGSEFGRIGYSSQICEYPSHTIVESKMRIKLKKGYTELKVINSTLTHTSPVNSDLTVIAKKQISKNSNPVLDNLIDRLVKSNIHNITTSTQITYNATSGLFTTPLGIVTLEAISDARNLLGDIIDLVKEDKYNSKLDKVASQYLRLIPQNIGMKFNTRNIFPNVLSVQSQNNILDSLEASYQAVSKAPMSTNESDIEPNIFAVDIQVVDPLDTEYKRINAWYETSKNSVHGYDRVKIRNMFKVTIKSMDSEFIKSDSNIKEVWHGTGEGNCLSILRNGLKTSPPSTVKIAGKNFGNGIYGAIHSTKSLGYTFSKWGQPSGDSGWLYVCDFALGKAFEPTHERSKPTGYDSVWARASKAGLLHDELIVYQNNRVNIKYLIECK